MENKKTCADCINLGREVYCMKCKRLKNGYKDLFVDAAPVQAKPPVASKKIKGSRRYFAIPSASFLLHGYLYITALPARECGDNVGDASFCGFYLVIVIAFPQLFDDKGIAFAPCTAICAVEPDRQLLSPLYCCISG